MGEKQKQLSAEQLQDFYHDYFVAGEVDAFVQTLGTLVRDDDLVVD